MNLEIKQLLCLALGEQIESQAGAVEHPNYEPMAEHHTRFSGWRPSGDEQQIASFMAKVTPEKVP